MPLKVENKPRWEVQKGRAKTFRVTVKDENGVVENLSSATVVFTVKTDYGGTQLFQTSLTGGETGADFAAGIIAVPVTAANTSAATIPTGQEAEDFVFELKVTLSAVPYAVIVDRSRTGIFRVYQTIS